jgi:hypothetical protein
MVDDLESLKMSLSFCFGTLMLLLYIIFLNMVSIRLKERREMYGPSEFLDRWGGVIAASAFILFMAAIVVWGPVLINSFIGLVIS